MVDLGLRFRFLILALIPLALEAQKFHTYVGQLDSDSVVLAWGTTTGDGNTIGRTSTSHGRAQIRFGDRTLTSEQNWITIGELRPDTEYSYEIRIGEERVGQGKVRTWPAQSERLVFFVIGDYGNGSAAQNALAGEMVKEFDKRAGSGNPVRFVLTTGDNIYGKTMFGLRVGETGDKDKHWGDKFFRPYARLLAHIPFYPTLGNHDGNSSESRRDLEVYLDNFFFPGGKPARYYRFSYAGLADFFALDTTDNTESGPAVPAYIKSGAQFRWMTEVIPKARARWKIPYFHHPPYSAGPRHVPALLSLQHFVDLFRSNGVRVAFNGHEHNFQYSEASEATGGIRYVVTGAGGELRGGDALSRMREAHIEGWAPTRHFLVVEIEGDTMRITPMAGGPIRVVDAERKELKLPIIIQAR